MKEKITWNENLLTPSDEKISCYFIKGKFFFIFRCSSFLIGLHPNEANNNISDKIEFFRMSDMIKKGIKWIWRSVSKHAMKNIWNFVKRSSTPKLFRFLSISNNSNFPCGKEYYCTTYIIRCSLNCKWYNKFAISSVV